MNSKLIFLIFALALVVPSHCEGEEDATTAAPEGGAADGATTEASDETTEAAIDEDKDQKFKSPKKWHEDFEARVKTFQSKIPSSSNDYKTEIARLDVLKRMADLVRRMDDATAKRDFNFRGESTMKDLENRLNDLGRRAFPLTWRTVKCGIKHQNLYDCGKA